MKALINIFVPGIPGTRGSKRGFAIKKGGVYTGRVAVMDTTGDKGKQWMQTVKQFVAEVYKDEPVRCPVALRMAFVLPRPKSHYGSGRNADQVKDSAPHWHTNKPDALKMARAVEDALTGIIYHDDCQVVVNEATKQWGDRPGCRIVVEVMGGAPAK